MDSSGEAMKGKKVGGSATLATCSAQNGIHLDLLSDGAPL